MVDNVAEKVDECPLNWVVKIYVQLRLAQLPVGCSMVKRERAWYFSSRE